MASALFVGQLGRHFLAGGEGLVTVVKIYVDEAGTDAKSPVLTVAGYAARPSQWQAFTKEWNRVLKPTGIKCYHATDAQACKREFKTWNKDQVDSLAAKLLPIIPKYAVGLAISIEMRDFNAAISGRPDLKALFGNPYGACFHWLVATLLEWTKERKWPARYAFVHETNDMKKDAIAAFEWIQVVHSLGGRLSSLSFADKEQFCPLQAADILAFEAGKRIANQDGPERRALTALNPDDNKIAIRFYDKKNMPTLIQNLERVKAIRDREEGRPS